jgi:nitrogen fixation protein NifQ
MEPGPEVSHETLMSYARRADDVLAHAFAGAVRTALSQGVFPALLFGLSETQFRCLLDRYFPGAWQDLFVTANLLAEKTPCPAFREEEIKDLVALLLDHRVLDGDETHWLAFAIATACMGNNHLWQDLGLTGRQALSDLLQQNFTALFEKNVGNMKWKKFFYKQLCDRAEVNLCKAPSCQVCDDYQTCFGPEDGSGLAALSVASGRAREPLPG